MNIADHILGRLDEHGTRPVFGTATGDVPAAAFARQVRARMHALAGSIGEGDPIVVFNQRGMDFWIDLLAVWGLGGVTIPVAVTTDETSMATMIRVAKPRGYLGSPGLHEEALASHGPCRADPAPAGAPPAPKTDGTRQASVNFTSGSTGEPKGVLLTHDALVGNLLATREAMGVTSEDRVAVPIPFNFMSAVAHFLVCMSAGACLIATEEKLMQRNLFEFFKATRADALGGAPVHLRWISELCEQEPTKIRWLMASGDHLGVDVIEQLEKSLPETRLIVVYGLTEVGGRCCILDRGKVRAAYPDDPRALIESVGRPMRGLRAQVLDDDGAEVPIGEIGEITISGDYLFTGYLNNEEATKKALKAGRLHTGDMGRVDADGNVFVMGRKDDVFKCSGLKVATVPIADALMDIGIFADVAVRPKEHIVAGHVPEALYVLKEGATFQKGEVIGALRETLPLHWIPQQFTQVDVIPRTGSGKISRRDLKKLETDPTGKGS